MDAPRSNVTEPPISRSVYNRRNTSVLVEGTSAMDTSASLLASLRNVDDEQAWSRLVQLYTPLMRSWLRRYGAALGDAEDVIQEVLTVVVRRFEEFRREPRTGAFRAWLRTITANCLRDHWRRKNKQADAVGGSDFGNVVEQLADPNSGISQVWNREHDEHVIRYLFDQLRGDDLHHAGTRHDNA